MTHLWAERCSFGLEDLHGRFRSLDGSALLTMIRARHSLVRNTPMRHIVVAWLWSARCGRSLTLRFGCIVFGVLGVTAHAMCTSRMLGQCSFSAKAAIEVSLEHSVAVYVSSPLITLFNGTSIRSLAGVYATMSRETRRLHHRLAITHQRQYTKEAVHLKSSCHTLEFRTGGVSRQYGSGCERSGRSAG